MVYSFILFCLICKPLFGESVYLFNDRVYSYLSKLNSHKELKNLKNFFGEHTNDIDDDNFLIKKVLFSQKQLSVSGNNSNLEFNNKMNDIPEDFLVSLYSIKDSDELMQVLTEDGNIDKMRLDYLLDGKGYESEEGLRLNRPKLPKLFAPAGCTPEIKTIEIDPPDSKSELYFPWCVKLPQCSGCCPSKRLTCIPATTSFVNITVVKLKYAGHGGKFKFSGIKTFIKQKHETCRCECLQKKKDCNLFQIYNQEECRCICNDVKAASACMAQEDKYWDYNDCKCKCIVVNKCSSDLRFNHRTCRCEALHSFDDSFKLKGNRTQTEIMYNSNEEHEIGQMDKYHRLGGSNGINPEKLILSF